MARNYLNNPEFLKCIIGYKEKCKLHETQGKIKPRIPEYAGMCIQLISNKLSTKLNFSGYTYREEMVEDGIENAITYFDNFDPDKNQNPFGYFSRVIWNAFLRRIEKEQKEQYIKLKNMTNQYLFDGLSHHQESGENPFGAQKFILDGDEIHNDFITNYEEKQRKKKEKNKQKILEKKQKKLEEDEQL